MISVKELFCYTLEEWTLNEEQLGTMIGTCKNKSKVWKTENTLKCQEGWR